MVPGNGSLRILVSFLLRTFSPRSLLVLFFLFSSLLSSLLFLPAQRRYWTICFHAAMSDTSFWHSRSHSSLLIIIMHYLFCCCLVLVLHEWYCRYYSIAAAVLCGYVVWLSLYSSYIPGSSRVYVVCGYWRDTWWQWWGNEGDYCWRKNILGSRICGSSTPKPRGNWLDNVDTCVRVGRMANGPDTISPENRGTFIVILLFNQNQPTF